MKDEPLVLCLTNTVAANFTANALLAIGAKPAMIEEPSEAACLASVADAILVNVGTVTPAQAETMLAAVRVAETQSIPWVLDPVAVQSLSYRRRLVRELLNHHPSLVRGNAAEIDYLRSACPAQLEKIPLLSTGKVDRIYLGKSAPIEVTGGVAMLQSVTATGCAQGAICAAYLGWGQAPEKAAIFASKLMKIAGERAFERAKTPGSFQITLLDELYTTRNHELGTINSEL